MTMENSVTHSESTGRLAENIVYFARALRAAGIPVGPGAVLDALEALKVAGVGKRLSEQVVGFVQGLRKQDLFKAPGVAETLDWAGALSELDVTALDPATVSDTLGVLLKYQDDIARLEGSKVKDLLDQVKSELRAAE